MTINLGERTYYSSDDYTIGKGSLYFRPDGETAYRVLGNAPSLTFNTEIETLIVLSQRSGMNEKDLIENIGYDLTGAFTLNQLKPKNLELFYMSDGITDASQTSQTDLVVNVTTGATAALLEGMYPLGYYNLTALAVATTGGSPVWVLNTDYERDLLGGFIYLPSTTSIPAGTVLDCTLSCPDLTMNRIDAGSATTVVGHFLYHSQPPQGHRMQIRGYGALTPGGENALLTPEGNAITELQFEIQFQTHEDYVGIIELKEMGTV